MPKKIYIRTFGCQMNDRDSEIVVGMLEREGYALAKTEREADAILFNTCSVRQHAEDRVYGQVRQLASLKKENPLIVIGVVGCMGQNYKDKILKDLPQVDFVAGPGNIYDIPELVKDAMIMGKKRVAVDKLSSPREDKIFDYRENKLATYVSISEGCNNMCSYCIVPFVRGREVSRQPKQIVKEIKDLVERGFKDATLLGQNVNSYGKDLGEDINFVKLLEMIDKTGIERLRFITSHPKDASEDLWRAMRDFGSVCEYLHLPFQSGSDKILGLMNRGYAAADYMKLIEGVRSYVPDCAINTDVIVGFPGETEEDFLATKKLMEDIQFDSAFIFKYSPRPPAQSTKLADDVPQETKESRNQVLLEMQQEISRKKNEALVGSEVEVLVESKDKKGNNMQGRTRTNKIAVFPGGKELIGKFVMVKIESVMPNTLLGKVVGAKDGAL